MSSVIEINGKKYDAATGKLLETESGEKHSKTRGTGSSVDGMTKNSSSTTKRKSAAHTTKQTQRTKTLMRSAVRKPTDKPKKKPTKVTGITRSQLGVSRQRQQLAAKTKQSPLVSHFGSSSVEGVGVVKKVQHMPVKKQSSHPKARKIVEEPKKYAVAKVGKAASHTTIKRKNVAAAKMIEAALANATSHEQPPHQKPKKHRKIAHKLGVSARAVAISSTVLAGVLLGGFFAVQNVPNLSMRVAAARAGFDATMPDYSPSGFSFRGPIQYNAGQVTISFRSNSDSRHYDITQRASNWNSEALLANFVSVNGQRYQSYEDRGRTLFIYGDSNATWVDNGIWYQLEGDSQMTTDQIIRVAASM